MRYDCREPSGGVVEKSLKSWAGLGSSGLENHMKDIVLLDYHFLSSTISHYYCYFLDCTLKHVGSFFPDQRSYPHSPALEGGVLITGPLGKSLPP